MLFNSLQFAIFLPIVFAIYWLFSKKDLLWQNLLLMVASYFFYACWNWHFLFLLLFSTLVGYISGLCSENRRSKIRFWLAILTQLAILGVFKYYNFFVESFAQSILHADAQGSAWTLEVVLPVGISFYTLHGLSYMLDVHQGKIKAEHNFIDYSLFVSFFPLLVAGPIERATHLLPQIKRKRTFDRSKAVDGLRQILWGLFKKVVVADQCAKYVNQTFGYSDHYYGSSLLLGAILFAIQIYGDFSGYSDIAIGVARLFGFDLLRNFAFPYFSRDIAEFWRRWHISLSSWLRDYLYIPLGGSRGSTWFKIRNVFIIFLVCGFWHGANWTYVVWGGLNALFMVPSIILKTNRKHLDTVAKGKFLPSWSDFFAMLSTFALATFTLTIFRSPSIAYASHFIAVICSKSILSCPILPEKALFIVLILFIVIEWMGREQQHALANFGFKLPRWLRLTFYYVLILCILYYIDSKQQFIYFQF